MLRRNISIYFYLNGRRKAKDGYPVKIAVWCGRIGARGTTEMRSTGYYLNPSEWSPKDKSKGDKGQGVPKDRNLRRAFEIEKVRAWKIAENIEPFTFSQFWEAMDGVKGERANLFFWIDKRISEETNQGTKNIYKQLRRFIERMAPRRKYIALAEVTPATLERWKKKAGSTNVNFYYRSLKAIIRKAVREKALKENPFDFYDMPAPAKKEKKGYDLTPQELRKLFAYKPANEAEAEALRRFKLAYMVGGHGLADLARIRHEDIKDGELHLQRKKTQKTADIPITSEVAEILRHYKTGGYVLPILGDNKENHTRDIANATSWTNSRLKKIAAKIGIREFTMYWARHTAAAVWKRGKISELSVNAIAANTEETRRKHYTPDATTEEKTTAIQALMNPVRGERAPEE